MALPQDGGSPKLTAPLLQPRHIFSCTARLSNFLVRSPKLLVSRYLFGGIPCKSLSHLVHVDESREGSRNRPRLPTLDRRDHDLS
jgi:hypothetical protein